MSYKLFLDDDADTVRQPALTVENKQWRAQMNLPARRPTGHGIGSRWTIAKTVAEAKALVEQLGFPSFVSFDHDLGDGETAMAFARHLIDLDLDHSQMPVDFSFEVHSANPVGRENIRSLLERYLLSKKS